MSDAPRWLRRAKRGDRIGPLAVWTERILTLYERLTGRRERRRRSAHRTAQDLLSEYRAATVHGFLWMGRFPMVVVDERQEWWFVGDPDRPTVYVRYNPELSEDEWAQLKAVLDLKEQTQAETRSL